MASGQYDVKYSELELYYSLILLGGRSQNTVPIASTQVAIKGIVQYSTKSVGQSVSRAQDTVESTCSAWSVQAHT